MRRLLRDVAETVRSATRRRSPTRRSSTRSRRARSPRASDRDAVTPNTRRRDVPCSYEGATPDARVFPFELPLSRGHHTRLRAATPAQASWAPPNHGIPSAASAVDAFNPCLAPVVGAALGLARYKDSPCNSLSPVIRPSIETERLRLRPFAPADAVEAARLAGERTSLRRPRTSAPVRHRRCGELDRRSGGRVGRGPGRDVRDHAA